MQLTLGKLDHIGNDDSINEVPPSLISSDDKASDDDDIGDDDSINEGPPPLIYTPDEHVPAGKNHFDSKGYKPPKWLPFTKGYGKAL